MVAENIRRRMGAPTAHRPALSPLTHTGDNDELRSDELENPDFPEITIGQQIHALHHGKHEDWIANDAVTTFATYQPPLWVMAILLPMLI